MDKLSTWAEMGVGWCGRNGLQAREADVEMTGMGIISSPCFGQLYYWSSLLSVITSHSGIAHRHIGPTHWGFAQSSLWNVYSNNQTYGVIQIDLYFPRARVINPTDRNVCDARNDRNR